MPLVTTAELGGAARSAGTGVGAFNVITLEHAEGIVAGAESVGQPVILQISQNTVRFHLGRYGRSPRRPARSPRQHWCRCPSISTTSRTPSSLTRPPPRASAPLMYDASTQPYDDNVAATRRAGDRAHDHGLWLKAELGEVGAKSGAHAPGARTDPAEAAAYVAETGVDSLADAIGSSHAMTTQRRPSTSSCSSACTTRSRCRLSCMAHQESPIACRARPSCMASSRSTPVAR
jgi:fructose-bisphosphate aldolase class II